MPGRLRGRPLALNRRGLPQAAAEDDTVTSKLTATVGATVGTTASVLTISGAASAYRLARKANGDLVLQGRFDWIERGAQTNSGFDWRDIETQVEPKALRLLAEHNAERQVKIYGWECAMHTPQPNGIACPKCGAELVDPRPNETLTSFPPQKNTAC